jgi:putative copper export protein
VGNPLTSEVAAFRWLVVVLAGAASVVLVAKLISSTAAIYYGAFLLLVLALFIARGMVYLMSSPENDDRE